MRILVISPPLILDAYRARWLRMANHTSQFVSIRALVPEKRTARGYGEDFYIQTENETCGRFELKRVKTTHEENRRYLIVGLRRELEDFQPDVIFCVHHEGVCQLLQTIVIRKLFFGRTKLVYFSMSAFPRLPKLDSFSFKKILKVIYSRISWLFIRKGTDGALCHYERIQKQMIKEGYKKPILIQTQYGVDPEQFKRDDEDRLILRKKMGLHGTIIGFCGRFVPEKGLRELMQAFEHLNGDTSLLLIGDGEMREEIEQWIASRSFEHRVFITGYTPHDEVQKYFNILDIFVLGSIETPTYIDTFPLVVAQAMTMGIPVVGSMSGAIPYQLGKGGLLFPERDSRKLCDHLQYLVDAPEKRKKIGKSLQKRALELFCIDPMNREFIRFLKEEIFGFSQSPFRAK